MDNCSDLIAMYEAQIKLVKIVHRYLHDGDLPWRPDSKTKLSEVKAKVKQLAYLIGAEAADEVEQAVKELEETLFSLGWT